jgi:hypothetical protein
VHHRGWRFGRGIAVVPKDGPNEHSESHWSVFIMATLSPFFQWIEPASKYPGQSERQCLHSSAADFRGKEAKGSSTRPRRLPTNHAPVAQTRVHKLERAGGRPLFSRNYWILEGTSANEVDFVLHRACPNLAGVGLRTRIMIRRCRSFFLPVIMRLLIGMSPGTRRGGWPGKWSCWILTGPSNG